MSENPDPRGLSRRTIVKAAAWTTPVIVMSTAVPAMAASPTDTGVIVWTSTNTTVASGFTGTLSGVVTATTGALPSQVLITYGGATVQGPASATVDPGTGLFTVLVTAQSVAGNTVITASAPGFGSAALTMGVTIATTPPPTTLDARNLVFNKWTPETGDAVWVTHPRQESGGVITDLFVANELKVNDTGLSLGGIFSAKRGATVDITLLFKSMMSIELINTNNPLHLMHWNYGRYGFRGDVGDQIGSDSHPRPYRVRVGYDGACPTHDGVTAWLDGDDTGYRRIVRTKQVSLPNGQRTVSTFELKWDVIPNYRVLLVVNMA